MINVLLVCGGGASSGFLAQSMRKSAKKKGLQMDVIARSETEITAYKDDKDVLLVGPHLEYLLDDINEKVSGSDIKVAIIDRDIYASLDGDRAVDFVLELMEK